MDIKHSFLSAIWTSLEALFWMQSLSGYFSPVVTKITCPAYTTYLFSILLWIGCLSRWCVPFSDSWSSCHCNKSWLSTFASPLNVAGLPLKNLQSNRALWLPKCPAALIPMFHLTPVLRPRTLPSPVYPIGQGFHPCFQQKRGRSPTK